MTTPTSSAGESLVYKLSLAAQVRAVHDGSFTAEALLEAHLAQTAAHDTQLGAYIRIDADAARQSARALDARRAAGLPLGPLAGAVLAVKDQICTQGLATTAGSKVLGNWVPPYDATVVARLRAAGAVILGKANQDEFAMGSSTENSAFFPAKNPWDPTRVPGGSSGGSAIAVACGMAAGALGTDTGGSVRQPASFCGVVGLKPTYGRVSRYGAIAYASSLDQVGPLARTVEDVALLFQTIAGQDAHDATSLPHPLDDFRAAATDPAGLASLAGLRVGVPQEYYGAGVAPDVQAAIEAALAELVALGATLVPVSLPHSRYAVPAYYLIATAEASSNLARYDGLRFGHRSQADLPLDELVAQTRAEGFGPEVKRRIALGTFALSSGYYDAYYLRAQKVRRLIRDDFDRAFEAVDLLAAPVSPFTAFKLGERTSDPVAMYLADIDTVPASLAGVSALSVPAGFDRQQLPIGLQLIGPPLAEARLLRVAAAYERAHPWHRQRPVLTPGAPA